MKDLELTSLEEWRDRELTYKLFPEKLWPILLGPCEVRILMVTDSGGSFGTGDFGLKALIDTLAVPPGPWVRFEITTANRRVDPTADIEEFDFSRHPLEEYDQIWLFGIEQRFSPELSEPELSALSQFMDDGGGVFATGDHEDLGVAMCGSVPRVRSMRKWHWPQAGPHGEPVAPPVGGLDRLDTLRPGPTPGFQFDDQSDDLPQQISPQMYPTWTLAWKIPRSVHPHPVLCGPRGVIRVLPDHPHEGECYVPSDLTASFTFDGYTTEEYPADSNGNRVPPEVIATSVVQGGRTAADVKGPVTPRQFGAIGVWDGHRVDRGRVLVDATWHHFFNINLVGDPNSPYPEKRQGFLATAAGQAAYEEIKAYFRNIAVWLARPERQACMRRRALWALRWHHRIFMDLRPEYFEGGLKNLDLPELLRIGEAARDVLGRLASRCQVRIWSLELIRELQPLPWKHVEPWIDPWIPFPPEPQPDPVPWMQVDVLPDAVLGGAVYALADAFRAPDREIAAKAEDLDWSELLAPATEVAMREVREALRRSSQATGELAEVLAEKREAT